MDRFKELSPEADEFPKVGLESFRCQRTDSPFFPPGLFFVLFCLFVCFLFSLSFFSFLLATKFGLSVLQFKSEISKCFLHSNF